MPTLVDGVAQREQERERLQWALAATEHLANVTRVDTVAIRRELQSILADWRRLLGAASPADPREASGEALRFTPQWLLQRL